MEFCELRAIHPHLQKKGKLLVEVFLAKWPEVLKRILAQAQRSLRDTAAVNSTRWVLSNAHTLDAACVGQIHDWQKPTLAIKCTGRSSYRRTRLDKFSFPRGYLRRKKRIQGFQTGDLVKAIVPSGKKEGTHRGRVAVRASGNFNIQTRTDVVQGISHRHCHLIQRNDDYGYFLNSATHTGREQVTAPATTATQSALYLPPFMAGFHAQRDET